MQKKSLFTPRKLLFWVCIIFVALSLNYFNAPSESERVAVVTAVAMDIVDDEFYFAVNILSPTDSKQVKEKVFLAHGDNMTDAVDNLSLMIGKKLGFAHCNVIAVGENLAVLGIPQHIDNLIRTKKADRNSLLITFVGDPKEFLEAGAFLKKELSLKPEHLLQNNEKELQSTAINIEEFYSAYYSENGVALVSTLFLTSEEDEGIEISPSSSSAGQNSTMSTTQDSQSTSSSTTTKYLKNDGTTSVFKNGRKVFELTQEQMRQCNLFKENKQKGTIEVSNITDDFYNNATIVFDIKQQVTKLVPSFENNQPKLTIKSAVDIRVVEIQENDRNFNILKIDDNYATPAAKEALLSKMTGEIESILTTAQSNKIDFLGVSEKFSKRYYQKWQTFINSLDDQEAFLDNIVFEIQPSIRTVSF